MFDIIKYPRTRHVQGSRLQHGDDLEDVPVQHLTGKHLVIEEKIDGSNCGISFSPEGELLLQSRGHYLRGGPREKHFSLLKQWSMAHADELFDALGDRYVVYGEWMFAKHTMFYDALPHYFMEFDVLDKTTNSFLDTPSRRNILRGVPVESVPVLLETKDVKQLQDLKKMIKRSKFITDHRDKNLVAAAAASGQDTTLVVSHTDASTDMEGLYLKWEEDSVVKERYKFVRSTFTSSILDQETHWHDRPIVQNGLVAHGLERMFER